MSEFKKHEVYCAKCQVYIGAVTSKEQPPQLLCPPCLAQIPPPPTLLKKLKTWIFGQ